MSTEQRPNPSFRPDRSGPARRRPGVRPAAFLALVLGLAYGGGAWLRLIHDAAGDVTPGGWLGLLRDSTLALPLVALAVWLTFAVARRVPGIRVGGLGTLAVITASIAVAASLASGVATIAGTSLLGIRHVQHGLPVATAAVAVVDVLVALSASLVIVATVFLLFRGAIWSELPAEAFRSRLTRSVMVRRGMAVMASFVMAASSASLLPVVGIAGAVQASGGGGPCPAAAPVKSFDVSAIDVKMWLNRFGDNDPTAQMYVLDSMIDDVRAQEAAGPSSLSIGLRDDPIQPLAIRVNEGDCVVIHYTNSTTRPAPHATDHTYGIHIDGLAFDMSSSGDAIGNNASSAVAPGASATYTYYVPNDPTLEGAHYVHPGPAQRQAVAHGLFGTLNVEPAGSTYLNPTTGQPQVSGWEAIIVPAHGKSFRENVKVFHEIGNEGETDQDPVDINGVPLPTRDPHNGAYRPGSRAIDYRSEPFMDRLNESPDFESSVYGSYTFGDTTNIMPLGYVGDPTKFRLVHGGSEVFHVYHLHGGADRWRFNPKADPTFEYGKTGLDKHPVEIQA